MKSLLSFAAIFFLLFSGNIYSQDWVARHSLSAQQYQNEFDKWTKLGYRPTDFSGFNGKFSVIFEKQPNGPAWEARHGLSNAQYQAEFNKWTKQGYRPVKVHGYAAGNQDNYVALFEKRANSMPWVAKHGISEATYQKEFDTRTKQGYMPTDISAYTVNGTTLFSVIFDKIPGAAGWVAKHNLNNAEYQAEFNKWVNQGYRLKLISGYTINGAANYAAVWQKGRTNAWQARHAMSTIGYQDEFDKLFYQGYRPVAAGGFPVKGEDTFTGIWEAKETYKDEDMKKVDKAVADFMKEYDVPGLSFAITKDDKLVLAKTYGFANKETGEMVAPRHRFRIASVSKPITAVTVMSLIENGKLNLSDKIFGTNARLGTTYGTTPYKTDIDKITLRNLLMHTGGGWTNDGNDPMFSNLSKNHKELISWTLDNQALKNTPGSNYAYSNFGYCVLGRVIEKVTNQDYETYVQNNILNKCNITNMEIGGDTENQRKANEVKYYGQGNDDPYAWKVARMDAHGGWIANAIDLVKFATRVNKVASRTDILKAATLDTMFKAYSPNTGYAKGWSVNASNNYWHLGALPGEHAALVRTSDGFTWSILVNTRSKKDDFTGDLDKLMWTIKGSISSYPSFNFF